VKIMWDRPTSVGYGTYFPSNAYGIEYYIIEISPDVNFVNLADKMTCRRGQDDTDCYYGLLIAQFRNLSVTSTYYYRIRAGTVVGQGQNSSTGIIGLCNIETTPNAQNDIACFLNYSSGCNAGYNYLSGCTACPAGKYATITDVTCKSCTYGQYTGEAAPKCLMCPPGTWSNVLQATTCMSCGGRHYSGVAGATFVSLCVLCPPGTYVNEAEQKCISCPGGTYAQGPDTDICTSCGEGMYGGGTGATELFQCVTCPAGTYANESALTCTACVAGKWAAVSATTCLTCESGKYSTTGNACTACPPDSDSPAESVSISNCTCNIGYTNEKLST